MSPMQFKIEQDEKSYVFMASRDDPGGGGITTQANALPALYSAIWASCVKLPCDLPVARLLALKRLGFLHGDQEGLHIRLSKAGLRVPVPNHPQLRHKRCKALADK